MTSVKSKSAFSLIEKEKLKTGLEKILIQKAITQIHHAKRNVCFLGQKTHYKTPTDSRPLTSL